MTGEIHRAFCVLWHETNTGASVSPHRRASPARIVVETEEFSGGPVGRCVASTAEDIDVSEKNLVPLGFLTVAAWV